MLFNVNFHNFRQKQLIRDVLKFVFKKFLQFLLWWTFYNKSQVFKGKKVKQVQNLFGTFQRIYTYIFQIYFFQEEKILVRNLFFFQRYEKKENRIFFRILFSSFFSKVVVYIWMRMIVTLIMLLHKVKCQCFYETVYMLNLN